MISGRQIPIYEKSIKAIYHRTTTMDNNSYSEDSDSKVNGRSVNPVSVKLAKTVKTALGDEFSQETVHKICNAFIKVIIDNVKSGNTVTLTNNMSFKRILRNERVHKNPKDRSKVITKPAHYVMKMEVKQALKTAFESIDVIANEADIPTTDDEETDLVTIKRVRMIRSTDAV